MERNIRIALATLLGAPLVASLAFASSASAATVTIAGYVNGQPATASTAANYSFPMQSSWTGGSGSFSLGPTGFNNPNPYQATTNDMATGTSYSVSETAQDSCTSNYPFSFVGYSTGDTLADAANASVSSTSPNFTNLQNDEYVVVWHKSCATAPQPVSPANGTSLPSDQLTSVSWTSVSDSAQPVQYFYEVSNSSTVNSTDGSFASPIYQSGAIASTSLSVSGTAPGTYYWHVRAQDAAGNFSPWGAISSITVTSPSGNGTTTPPTSTSTSAISGTVFKDQNGNRQLDSGEQGISGAQLVLLDLSDLSAQPQQFTADANGDYSFSNLPVGTYLVLAKLQQGDVPTVWPHVIRLDGTTSVTDQDFGERTINYGWYGFPFGLGFGLGHGHSNHDNMSQNIPFGMGGMMNSLDTGSSTPNFGNGSNAGFDFGSNNSLPNTGYDFNSSNYGFNNYSNNTPNSGFGMGSMMLGLFGVMR